PGHAVGDRGHGADDRAARSAAVAPGRGLVAEVPRGGGRRRRAAGVVVVLRLAAALARHRVDLRRAAVAAAEARARAPSETESGALVEDLLDPPLRAARRRPRLRLVAPLRAPAPPHLARAPA